MSAPRSSKCVAKLCRNVCGVVRKSSPASFKCFSNIRATLRVVMRRPNLLRKMGASSPSSSLDESLRTLSHRLIARVANDPRGASRSRRPLPRTRTNPFSKSRSPSLMSTVSLTRKPAEYIVSKIARSRSPMSCVAGGASSSLPISSVDRKCGSLRSGRGLRSGFAGLLSVRPSR